MIKFLDLHAQYMSIKPEIDAAIADTIAHSAYIGGEKVKKFEEAFAAYIGAKHCIGVGNGTDAMEIALSSLGLPKGSKVLVPANSFIATSEAVTNAGFEVVFADAKEDYTIKLEMVEGLKAVICVHLYGLACDMDEMTAFCAKHSLALIEDCAQAHGAEFKGRKVGTFGIASSFSFYPGKNLGAYGDGGAIITNDDALAKKMRMMANHGRTGKYDHEFEGRNSRLDGLQAAVLSVKLSHLDNWLNTRNNIASIYLSELAATPLILPTVYSDRWHAWHLFVIRTDRRDELKAFLGSHGIETGVHYPIALPKLAAYSYISQDTSGFFACRTDVKLLSLPIGEHLSEGDAFFVCAKIKEFFDSTK